MRFGTGLGGGGVSRWIAVTGEISTGFTKSGVGKQGGGWGIWLVSNRVAFRCRRD